MKLINTNGILPSGEIYELSFVVRFHKSVNQNHLRVRFYKWDIDLERLIFQDSVSAWFDKGDYAKGLKEALIKAEKLLGVQLLKSEMQIAS